MMLISIMRSMLQMASAFKAQGAGRSQAALHLAGLQCR